MSSAHEVDAAAVLDLSHAIAGGVFDGRERRRIGARAGPVAAGGHGHVEGLVGPLEVVDMTPGREGLATVSEVAEATALEHLALSERWKRSSLPKVWG